MKLLSVKAIQNKIDALSPVSIQHSLASIIAYSHKGNVSPLIQTLPKLLAMKKDPKHKALVEKMIAYLREHTLYTLAENGDIKSAPKELRNPDFKLESLPAYNLIFKGEQTTTVSKLHKLSVEATAKNVAKLNAKLAVTTDYAAMKSKEAELKAMLKAVQTRMVEMSKSAK